MHSFFCPFLSVQAGKIIISDPWQLHHAKNVLRLKTKEQVKAIDEQGNVYLCLVEGIGKEILLLIKEKLVVQPNPGIKITVACALPKNVKMDDIVDKLTQLGVDRIIPLLSKRVVVKLDPQKQLLRRKRWEKIAASAVLQSQRCRIPEICLPQKIEVVLKNCAGFDLKLIPTLTGKRLTLKEALSKAKAKNILALIGPEGDFTDEELDLAKQAGCIPVSLGENVLRVDTAAIAVAAFIKLYK